MPFTIFRRQLIPSTMDDVFPFFEDAANLERITPPWLGFRIVRRPARPLMSGARIGYRLRLLGVPFQWETVIVRLDPGHGFVDVQMSGPYRSWVHVHAFSQCEDGILMEDRVDYEMPYGPVGHLLSAVVALQLEAIFDYRRDSVVRIFG